MIKSKGTRTAFVLLIVSMLGFILLLPKGTTDAHAHLSSSIPGEGETISEHTREFHLYFTSNLEQVNELILRTADGTEVEYAEQVIEPEDTISLKLDQSLAAGEYILYWDILGEDGHTTSGEIPFQVAQESGGSSQDAGTEQVAGATNVSQKAGQQLTLIYVASLLLLVIIIIFLVFLRKGKRS